MVKSIEVNVSSKTVGSGQVKWELSALELGRTLELKTFHTTLSEDFEGAKRVVLRATMTGGRGENAWQHTQLLGASRDSTEKGTQMKIVVKMIGKEHEK